MSDGRDNACHDRMNHEAYDEWRNRFGDGFNDDCDDSRDDDMCDEYERIYTNLNESEQM